jgi:hypothetical protein
MVYLLLLIEIGILYSKKPIFMVKSNTLAYLGTEMMILYYRLQVTLLT